MAFRDLIRGQVDNAFNIVGDLVTEVTFAETQPTGYNFTTGTPTVLRETTVVPAIFESISLENPISQTAQAQIIMKDSDISDLNPYDKVVIGTTTYNIVTWSRDGFVVTALLARATV